ncbi:MAG: hypothetical protein J6B53_04975 [Clostridia bacterium]|nr:hypothetical protein [Clostridia bacterium]
MKKTSLFPVLMLLCLLFLQSAAAETRQGVIVLEGMEEPIEETRFESEQGFSFWVANDRFSVQEQTGPKAGTVIRSLYLDDSMTLMPCTPEEAEKCLTESGMALSEPRGQLELQSEYKNGAFHFITLVFDNGHFLTAEGTYSAESADGTSKYFKRILDSICFLPSTVPDPSPVSTSAEGQN